MWYSLYCEIALLIFLYIMVWFVIAQVISNNSIMDIAWGMGFVLIIWTIFLKSDSQFPVFIPVLVTIWGLRLSVFIFWRNKGQGEDWRYANWRKEWGKHALIMAFFKVFLLQGVFMWVIALPFIQLYGGKNGVPLFFTVIGFFLFFIGFFVESIADHQLWQFKKNRKDSKAVLKKGLWAYSRHPNYFGEMLVWWGIFLMCLPYGNGWISLISPLTITFLLTKVSGVPMLEEKMRKNPKYREYMEQTNAFIPKIPIRLKKEKG